MQYKKEYEHSVDNKYVSYILYIKYIRYIIDIIYIKECERISYEPERDRLTWDGWDIYCGQGLEVLLPDKLGGGTWRAVSFEYNDEGWYMPGHPDVSPVGLWARERQD